MSSIWTVSAASGKAQAGSWVLKSGKSLRTIATPAAALVTKRASLPHITSSLASSEIAPHGLILSYMNPEVMKRPTDVVMDQCDHSLAKWAGWSEDFALMIGTRQPWEAAWQGSVVNNSVSLPSFSGNARFDTSSWIAATRARSPAVIQLLSDEVNASLSSKRARKAMERTVAWAAAGLKELAEAYKNDPENRPAVFATVQGGSHTHLINQCAKSLAGLSGLDLPIDGYVIGGLGSGESIEKSMEMITAVMDGVPEKSLVVVNGLNHPVAAFKAISLGVSAVVCSWPMLASNAGYAASWPLNPLNHSSSSSSSSSSPSPSSSYPAAEASVALPIWNPKWVGDHRPIVESLSMPGEDPCPCPLCSGGITHAYLHHLVIAKELLGTTMLSLHNWVHWARTMKSIQNVIAENRYSEWLSATETLWSRPVDSSDAPSPPEFLDAAPDLSWTKTTPLLAATPE